MIDNGSHPTSVQKFFDFVTTRGKAQMSFIRNYWYP